MQLALEHWERQQLDTPLENASLALPYGGPKEGASGSSSTFHTLFTTNQKQLLLDLIMKQLHSHNLTIKAFALRFLKRFLTMVASNDSIRVEITKRLSEHILAICKTYGLASGDAKGKFKLLNAMKNKMKEKELDERVHVVQAAMEVVASLHREVDVNVAPFVASITRRREPELAREAVRALVALTSPSGTTFLIPLAPQLPEFERYTKKDESTDFVSQVKQKRHKKEELYPLMNIEDTEARRYFVKLCTTVLPPLPKDWSDPAKVYELKRYAKPELQKWLKCLYCMYHDAEHTVFLDALSVVPRKNWAVFLEVDPLFKDVQLAKYVIERLCQCLRSDEQDSHLSLNATKAAYIFVSGFVIFRSRFPAQITDTIEEYMFSLWSTLSALHSSPDDEVRVKAYKVSLWHTRQVHIVVDQLKMEIQGNRSWSPLKLHELSVSLQQHSFVHKEVFDSLEDFCRYLCVQYSSRIDISLLMVLCKNQIRDDRARIFGARILKLLYFIMDHCMDGSKVAQNLILSIVDFLGEHANKICDEPSTSSKRIINSEPQIFSSDDKPSNKEIFFRPETFDIQNPAMKSIVARLMKCATYSTTVIRVSAVTSLAKIAFRSLDPIRLYIYQCLVFLEQSPIFGVNHQCAHIVCVLDQVYELHQQFYNLIITPNPTRDSLSRFAQQHDLIQEKIHFFCSFPKSWLPLGEESRELVDISHETMISHEIQSTAQNIEDLERELAG